MKILVYGAGNMGSLYAGLLSASGQEVSILARGSRLADLRERGIELQDTASGAVTRARPQPVETLAPDDAYDLVLVVLPKDRQVEVLPILAGNCACPSVMFFGNNAGGAAEMVNALGSQRILLGFPGAAATGAHDARVIRYLILSARDQPTTIGELDGRSSERLEAIRAALQQAGFPVVISSKMDAWLKTHAAEISPTANALYMTGGDPARLARTRDAIVLTLRAIREGYAVLRRRGIPITPPKHKIFDWLPEPLLIVVMKRAMADENAAIKIGHAKQARPEMRRIADELRALAEGTSITTPASDRLYAYLDSDVAPVADGSAEIPVRRGALWLLALTAAGIGVLIAFS